MAPSDVEVVIDLPPEQVWAAIRDVGAVHRRLLPNRVADTRIEGDLRILVYPDGQVIRELIVDVDDTTCRLAYAVIEGARQPITYHHASFQVFPEARYRRRLVWITDLLPDALATETRARARAGCAGHETDAGGSRGPLGRGPGAGCAGAETLPDDAAEAERAPVSGSECPASAARGPAAVHGALPRCSPQALLPV